MERYKCEFFIKLNKIGILVTERVDYIIWLPQDLSPKQLKIQKLNLMQVFTDEEILDIWDKDSFHIIQEML